MSLIIIHTTIQIRSRSRAQGLALFWLQVCRKVESAHMTEAVSWVLPRPCKKPKLGVISRAMYIKLYNKYFLTVTEWEQYRS